MIRKPSLQEYHTLRIFEIRWVQKMLHKVDYSVYNCGLALLCYELSKNEAQHADSCTWPFSTYISDYESLALFFEGRTVYFFNLLLFALERSFSIICE